MQRAFFATLATLAAFSGRASEPSSGVALEATVSATEALLQVSLLPGAWEHAAVLSATATWHVYNGTEEHPFQLLGEPTATIARPAVFSAPLLRLPNALVVVDFRVLLQLVRPCLDRDDLGDYERLFEASRLLIIDNRDGALSVLSARAAAAIADRRVEHLRRYNDVTEAFSELAGASQSRSTATPQLRSQMVSVLPRVSPKSGDLSKFDNGGE